MVVTLLMGGLGNQMFQYATARGINNGFVYIDPTFFETYKTGTESFTSRSLDIVLFPNIKAKVATPFLLKIIHSPSFKYRLLRCLPFLNFKKVSQIENEFVDKLVGLKGSTYLSGYFQCEKYFQHIRKELLKEFEFPQINDDNTISVANQIKLIKNSVSIHVRRGDYLKPNIQHYHGILPLKYYENSVSFIETKVSNPFYFIFSDDIQWCKNNLKFIEDRSIYVQHNTHPSDAWKDMYLMTLCHHHILANSSFSWWGAWLSIYQKAINIAPTSWLNSQVATFNIHDFIPDQWTLMTHD